MTENTITKRKVISSLIWKFLERGGVQGVQFILSVILARLVTPSDYGIIALLLVFIQIANVFIQTGFSAALVQKKESDDLDFSSVFFMSLFVATILYIILFFIAPLVSRVYDYPNLTILLRVIAITLFFGAFNSIQNAYVSKKFRFKCLFLSNIIAVFISGIIGIILAYNEFGIWALVFQQLSNVFLSCVVLWFSAKWRPKFVFSFSRLKDLFTFSWKLLCSSLLDVIFKNIYNLVIGKTYSTEQLGVFDRGQQFPRVIATNLDGSIQGVMFPTLSAYNDDVITEKKICRRAISSSAFILMPCMVGLATIAKPLVEILLTDKWLPCVPFMQLSCIAFIFYPIHTANLTAINALGRSDISLKLEIIKKTIAIITLLITIPLGIYAMAIGQVIQTIIISFIHAYPNKKLMDYSYFEQIKDLMPSFILSVVMGVIVWFLHFIHIQQIVLLVLQIISGIVIYVLLAKFSKNETFNYLISTLREVRK
ncbi:MAG: lipopolysaccharide biosynthesis protein [Treponema sp.]|nr:lipopolysaccharide biosynthesis protein [Treponema sp.]